MSNNIINNSERILNTIATNTANIKVEAESVDLNLDSLEVKVDLTNSRLLTMDGVLDASLVQQTNIEGLIKLKQLITLIKFY